MEPFQLIQDEIVLISEWKKLYPHLTAGFTTKNGGYSKEPFESFNLGLHVNDLDEHVHQNRVKLSEIIGFSTSEWVCSEQVHESEIKRVSTREVGKGVFTYRDGIPLTDGIYTDDPSILLTSCYADCVPLFFFAPGKKLIGLAHAGWRGTVQCIAIKMVERWNQVEGVSPKDILVSIGPSIRDCCYIVDDHVIQEVKRILDSSSEKKPFKEVSLGQYSLNLPLLNKQLLRNAGIEEEHILSSSFCTSCEEKLFFSHRRDQGSTGRMMSFIGYKED